jgi:chemotaxis protein methyltransferase CheR
MRGAAEAEAYQYISALVYDQCRIRLDESKRQLISSRLGKRLRQLGLSSLSDYCQLLRSPAREEEITHVVDALSTNFTHFMREPDHFRFLVQQALPAVLGPRKRFRIWSAACASGEEPYTIAFFLAECFPLHAGWDWQITATDVSTKALDKAVNGVYPEDRVDDLPRDWHSKYFQRGQGQWAGYYRVKPALRQRVTFRHLNLLGDYGFPEPFEVIFCRNVMIYFDRPTQTQLVQKFGQMLAPQGYLLIGHAESLNGLSVPFRCLRPSIYAKA